MQQGYDIVAAAGGALTATEETDTVTASGGDGINLSLINDTSTPAVLSGIEVFAANAAGVANPTVDLSVSANGGTSWTTVATGLTMDRFGRGSYIWTVPSDATPGNQYELEVTADQGTQPQGISAPFLVANAGNDFYINDGSTAGAVFTTAPGNDANSGTSPDQPMQSLRALLAAYTFGPGDTIYVDNGTYNVLQDIVLSPQDSGVTIVGPSSGSAVLDRGNMNSERNVFDLDGAVNVTLDQLQITGGFTGVYASSTAGSSGLTVENSTLFDNAQSGIDLESGNTNAILSGNTIFGTPGASGGAQNTGIYLAGSSGDVVTGNTLYQNSQNGIVINDGSNDIVSNNQVSASVDGISVSSIYGPPSSQSVTVSGNTVFDNTSAGIVSDGSIVSDNTVYGQLSPNAVGIVAYDSEVDGNLVYTNVTGISAQSSTVSNNRLYNNSAAAIFVDYSGPVFANQVYSNAVGIQTGTFYSGQIYDNLVYANTDDAILIESQFTSGVAIESNTVYQALGNAITIQDGTPSTTLLNNILYVLDGYDIDVAPDSQSGFTSDYNDLYEGTNPNAHIGYWTINGSATTLDTLSAWTAATGDDANSLSCRSRLRGYGGGRQHSRLFPCERGLPRRRRRRQLLPRRGVAGHQQRRLVVLPADGHPGRAAP